jgi:hypothetical protein
MSQSEMLRQLEYLSQNDLRDVALRAAELLQVKIGMEMTTPKRAVLPSELIEVQEPLGDGKNWPKTRARLIERLSW